MSQLFAREGAKVVRDASKEEDARRLMEQSIKAFGLTAPASRPVPPKDWQFLTILGQGPPRRGGLGGTRPGFPESA